MMVPSGTDHRCMAQGDHELRRAGTNRSTFSFPSAGEEYHENRRLRLNTSRTRLKDWILFMLPPDRREDVNPETVLQDPKSLTLEVQRSAAPRTETG